jgi:hypothetical protein
VSADYLLGWASDPHPPDATSAQRAMSEIEAIIDRMRAGELVDRLRETGS